MPYNFLNGDWLDFIPTLVSGDYYATVSWENYYGEMVTYTTNVAKFSGIEPGTFINMSENTSCSVPSDGDWYYYSFTPPISGTYYIQSTNDGDLDCYVYNNINSCLEQSEDFIAGSGEGGGF